MVIGALGLVTVLPFTIYCTYLRLTSGGKSQQLSTDDLSHLIPAYLSCILCASLFFLDASLQVWVFWIFLYFALAAYQFRLAYLSLRIFEQTHQSTYLCILVTYLTVMVLCYSVEVLCVIAYTTVTNTRDVSKVFKPVLIVQELCWLILMAGSIYLFHKFKNFCDSGRIGRTNITKTQGFNELLVVYAVQLVCQVAFFIVTIVDEFPFGGINAGFIVMACILMAFVILIQIIQLVFFKNTIRLKEL